MDDLKSLYEKLVLARRLKEEAEAQIAKATDEIVELARERESKTLEIKDKDTNVKLTVVHSERVTYDSEALKKELGRKWKLVSEEKVVTAKLKAAMLSGDVSAEKVAKCSSINRSAPHIRVSGA